MNGFLFYYLSIWWRIPTFIFFAVGAILCFVYRHNRPKLAWWGVLMFVLAATARLLDILWFRPWAREAERAGLWTIEQIDNIELLVEFARIIPTAVGVAFMVIVITRTKRKNES